MRLFFFYEWKSDGDESIKNPNSSGNAERTAFVEGLCGFDLFCFYWKFLFVDTPSRSHDGPCRKLRRIKQVYPKLLHRGWLGSRWVISQMG